MIGYDRVDFPKLLQNKLFSNEIQRWRKATIRKWCNLECEEAKNNTPASLHITDLFPGESALSLIISYGELCNASVITHFLAAESLFDLYWDKMTTTRY